MDQYIGRLLDNRYEILEIIGTGGMAVVYKARCHRLNRLVAIKILKDEYSRDDEFRRRFHHEGEAVAMLSHPNIVQVYDVSSTGNADFIVMELIDGITLKQYMEKKGTLNWKETLHFAMQIAKALEHAHGRGIVHRDIKPHNVMVLKNGSVKVTDFGIARVMSKSNTLTKEALGSVHYISPEQAKGGWVDNRSDLYSLSVVMYEMMTGRPPYDGESPVAVAIQHINGGAAMPSTLNPNIPGGLEQIIMKGMGLDTKDRYPSATEMLHDMDEFRKDPTILFGVPQIPNTEPTRKLNPEEVLQAARKTRTTAEKVAGTAAGAAGAAAAAQARAAGEQRRQQAEAARIRAEAAKSAAAAAQRSTASGQLRTQTHTPTNPPRRTREQIREEIREEERNRMATIAVVTCSAVAIIAIIIFLVLLVNGVLFNRGETTVTVPNLVGEYYDNIRDTQGLDITIGDYKHSDTVAKDKVISQAPLNGAQVVQGTKVTVIISLGPEPEIKVLDNLSFMPLEDAKAYLDRLGMNPLVKYEFSDTVEKGSVIRTDPAATTELKDGQTVWLICSSGPVIETAEMPNLIGLNYATAKSQLESMGFKDVNYVRKESEEDKDEVIAQPYPKGTDVDVTEEIVLTISKGPKKTEAPTERPTVKPTEPPEEPPTEKPTVAPTEAPREVTKTVILELPADRTEDYVISLIYNGIPVMEDTLITAGTVSYEITLTGSGTVEYELRINDTYYKMIKVVFS